MAADLDIVNVPPALNSAIEFLTAMVTPALLISATGSLVLSTSTRLGRVVDRVRWLEERLTSLIYADDTSALPLYGRRVEVVVDLLDIATSRSRILQRAMAAFYYGLGTFVLTCVTIAVAAIPFINRSAPWVTLVPVPVGIVGIMFLFWGCMLMLRETRMATSFINSEMDFTWELAREVAPEDISEKYAHRGKLRGLRPARLKDKHVSKIPNTPTGE